MSIEALRKVAHFRNLPEEALERLAQGLVETRIGADESVYETGDMVDALFVVAEGTVLVFRPHKGEGSLPVARLCEGDLLGTADLFDSERHSETARAVDPSLLLRADRKELLEFLEDHPQVVLNLQLAAARDLTSRAKVALAVAHRRAIRRRVNRKVRVRPGDQGALGLTLVDLSPFGMSLRGAPEGWQPPAVVEYRLEWGNRRLDFTGRVAWREGDSLGIDLHEPSLELQTEIGRMLDAMLNSPL